MIEPDTVSKFYERLITLDGRYYLDANKFIRKTIDDEPVLAKAGEGKLPLMLFHSKMSTGQHIIANPLNEPLSVCPENAWFWTAMSGTISLLTIKMMKEVIRLALNKDNEDIDYEKLEILQPFFDDIDQKTEKELAKIKPFDMLNIFYHRKARTGQIQTEVFDEDYRKSISGIRKKTWKVIGGMLTTILGTEEIEKTFTYKAKHIQFSEADVTTNLVLLFLEKADRYIKFLLELDLPINELILDVGRLEEYHKSCAWCTPANVGETAETANDINSGTVEWKPKTLPQSRVPGNGSTSSVPKNEPINMYQRNQNQVGYGQGNRQYGVGAQPQYAQQPSYNGMEHMSYTPTGIPSNCPIVGNGQPQQSRGGWVDVGTTERTSSFHGLGVL